MNRLSCVRFLTAMLAAAICEIAIAAPPDARADAEKIVGKLKFFATREFLYDREDLRQLPWDMQKEYFDLLRPLSGKQYPVEAWIALLKHKDAHLRTVALAALFAREDPKLLPHIASLMDDKARTFSQPAEAGSALFGFEGPKFDPKLLREQTVGHVAGQMIGFYLEQVGVDLHNRNPTPAEFKSYWDARQDRTHSAGWYGVQLARATQGTRPVPTDRTERVRAVRKNIDRLSPRDRVWVFLWLREDDWGDGLLISSEEMRAAAKELGPDRLLGLLRREADTDDPDWKYPQKMGTWRYRVATRFVLENAGKLLRPEDAQTLLAYEIQELQSVSNGSANPNDTAFWFIGAAQLQPDQANKILHDAFAQRFQKSYQKQDRVQLALALWGMSGLAETNFLLDWFYKEVPGLGEYGSGRQSFLGGAPGIRSPDVRKLFAAIVRDNRFDSLDCLSLMRLIEVLNGWTKEPVVIPEDLRKASHPYGLAHFTPWQAKAENEHPKETQNLLKTLETWRTAVRESLPRWEQQPAGKGK